MSASEWWGVVGVPGNEQYSLDRLNHEVITPIIFHYSLTQR